MLAQDAERFATVLAARLHQSSANVLPARSKAYASLLKTLAAGYALRLQ